MALGLQRSTWAQFTRLGGFDNTDCICLTSEQAASVVTCDASPFDAAAQEGILRAGVHARCPVRAHQPRSTATGLPAAGA